MRVCFLGLIFMLAGFQISSGRPSTPMITNNAYDDQLNAAITAFYQSHWNKSGQLLRELKKERPEDIRPWFFEAMIPFWKYFFGGNNPAAAKEFYQKSEKAIQVGLKHLKKEPSDTSVVLLLSGLYGYRSLAAANEKEYKIALQSGIKGFSFTRHLLMMDDNNPNALIGKGIFHYMIGSTPVELRWMTNLVGFSGSVKMGLAELTKAADSNSYVSTDAMMILCYLYNRDKKYQEALDYAQKLVKRYNDNIIFRYYYAMSLEKCGHRQQAGQQYQMILNRPDSGLEELKKISKKRLTELTSD